MRADAVETEPTRALPQGFIQPPRRSDVTAACARAAAGAAPDRRYKSTSELPTTAAVHPAAERVRALFSR